MAPIVSAADFGDEFVDRLASEGEYDLRITRAEVKETKKKDREGLNLMIVFDGADGADKTPINEFLVLPKRGEEKKTARIFMQRLIAFSKAFGLGDIKWFEYDPDSREVRVAPGIDAASLFTGQSARLPVIIEEGSDGRERNRIVLPRS